MEGARRCYEDASSWLRAPEGQSLEKSTTTLHIHTGAFSRVPGTACACPGSAMFSGEGLKSERTVAASRGAPPGEPTKWFLLYFVV